MNWNQAASFVDRIALGCYFLTLRAGITTVKNFRLDVDPFDLQFYDGVQGTFGVAVYHFRPRNLSSPSTTNVGLPVESTSNGKGIVTVGQPFRNNISHAVGHIGSDVFQILKASVFSRSSCLVAMFDSSIDCRNSVALPRREAKSGRCP